MDCADCTISLDTSLAKLARVIDIGMRLTLLAKRLIPTKCWYTTARVIASAEYAISLDTLLAKRLIPTKCWYTTARVIASAEYAISLDTLLAKRLKPTKCWHTTARVIADGLRWLHYLTRHTVSQAIDTYEVLIPVSWRLQGWLILEWLDTVSQAIDTYEVLIPVSWRLHWWLILEWLDTVSQAIDTYEVLIPVSWRLHWWLILEWLDTVSQAIDTYEVLTHNRKGDSLDCADCTISLDTSLAKLARVIDIGMSLTLLAKRLIPTKCWYTTALVIAWTALIALSHSTLR